MRTLLLFFWLGFCLGGFFSRGGGVRKLRRRRRELSGRGMNILGILKVDLGEGVREGKTIHV